MGLDTHPATTAGGSARDEGDFERLRHAREQHVGFAVGKYLQPAPMLFTRDGHNVYLGDMYRGHTAFLICGGPSLTTHDLSKLQSRGVLTLAVNNAAAVVRPQLWVSVDDPEHFCDAIWYDPGMLKFVPLCHMEKTFLVRDEQGELVKSPQRVGDMPGVFGYRRNESFNPEQWLLEDTFNWGNHGTSVDSLGNKGSRSVMLVAVRLLFYLGVRRVYLLGCDFRMEHGKQNYAFEQDRSRSSVNGNNSSYRILDSRFQALKPAFEREGFAVFNCTPDSGLTAFPYVPYEDAIDRATALMPRTIVTSGLYDRRAKQRQTPRNGQVSPPPRVERPALVNRTAPPCAPEGDVPDFTLIVPMRQGSAERLRATWLTWIKYQPTLRERPLILLHAADEDPAELLPEALGQSANRQDAPVEPRAEESMRQAWQRTLLEAAFRVETPWILKLDPAAIARGGAKWPLGRWFQPNGQGKSPVLIGSSWGYSKPAQAMERLDDWGDAIESLNAHPRLNLPFDLRAGRIKHDTLSGWCLFARTSWLQDVARMLLGGQLPEVEPAALLAYVAVRRREPVVRVPMKQHGWEHSYARDTPGILRECAKLLMSQDWDAAAMARG